MADDWLTGGLRRIELDLELNKARKQRLHCQKLAKRLERYQQR